MKNFVLLGAAGYIAPRHMQAIRATANDLVAAMDINDSVGILDSHFPDAQFFQNFELLDDHVKSQRRAGKGLDYVSIASPNFLHAAHMQWSLRSGADAICEKPLVLYPEQIDNLKAIEAETGQKIYTILQLRLHPAILALRNRVASMPTDRKSDVDLTYITSRGDWYLKSWKGATEKSGGIATNIGVHFYDMLHFVYGAVQENIVHLNTPTRAAGYIEYERARVRWFLSLDINDVPADERLKGNRTYRAVNMDGESIRFSDGFTELHTQIYRDILTGGGFGVEDNRVSIETVATIRNAPIIASSNLTHPFVKAK
jgi:UDP-N-acetyl-2-amino-2-deoxyglucuronate dehydrogenase